MGAGADEMYEMYGAGGLRMDPSAVFSGIVIDVPKIHYSPGDEDVLAGIGGHDEEEEVRGSPFASVSVDLVYTLPCIHFTLYTLYPVAHISTPRVQELRRIEAKYQQQVRPDDQVECPDVN